MGALESGMWGQVFHPGAELFLMFWRSQGDSTDITKSLFLLPSARQVMWQWTPEVTQCKRRSGLIYTPLVTGSSLPPRVAPSMQACDKPVSHTQPPWASHLPWPRPGTPSTHLSLGLAGSLPPVLWLQARPLLSARPHGPE